MRYGVGIILIVQQPLSLWLLLLLHQVCSSSSCIKFQIGPANGRIAIFQSVLVMIASYGDSPVCYHSADGFVAHRPR